MHFKHGGSLKYFWERNIKRNACRRFWSVLSSTDLNSEWFSRLKQGYTSMLCKLHVQLFQTERRPQENASVKADSHIACRSHAVPLRVQNVSFPFDLHSGAVSDSHLLCHAPTMPFFSRSQHGRRETRPHCVNQMKKTYSKPLAARHDRGAAWARHGNGKLCVNWP